MSVSRRVRTSCAAAVVVALSGCGVSHSNDPSPVAHGSSEQHASSSEHAPSQQPEASAASAVLDDAVAWQVSQLDRGVVQNVQYGSADMGLTLDTAVALVAVGGHESDLQQIEQAIPQEAETYIGPAGSHYAGSTAKLLYATDVLGLPARTGGTDLRSTLTGLMQQQGPDAGRFSDEGKKDYSTTSGQAYAVLALARTGQVPQPAVDHLLEQQCSDGGFASEQVAGKTCDQAQGTSDTDTTALAVQALEAATDAGTEVDPQAADDAASWLVSQQAADGAFSSSTSGPNSNSTGLAASTLALTGHTTEAEKAAQWVETMQLTQGADAGAIAFTSADLATAQKSGITDATRDAFRRATPQAVLALEPVDLATLTAG